MFLDIVILPPKELRERLGKKIKQATADYPKVIVVDNKKFIPHVSLFHIRTSKAGLKKISKLLPEIIKNYRSIKLSSTIFDIRGESGRIWFVLGLTNPRELRKLNSKVVYACRSFRTGMMPFTSKRKATKLEKQYRKDFGSRHILKLFRPHITLAMLKHKDDARAVERKWRGLKLNFTPDEVAITEVNYWHQVTRIIKKFKLNK